MMLPKLTGFRRFIAGRGCKFDAGPNYQTTSQQTPGSSSHLDVNLSLTNFAIAVLPGSE